MPFSAPTPRLVSPVTDFRASALPGLTADDIQEAKEAVCDAVVEWTRRMSSGEGERGQVVYGIQPSGHFVSGFIMPRLDTSGDEIASDISIPSHGLDCRIVTTAQGQVEVIPSFAVYVRALPTWEELTDPRFNLKPKPTFKREVLVTIKAEVQERMEKEAPGTAGAERSKKWSEFTATAIANRLDNRNVEVKIPRMEGDVDNGDGTVEQVEDGEFSVGGSFEDGEMRIPSRFAEASDIPLKYLRLAVETPVLRLPLPYDAVAWKAASAQYDQDLMAAVKKSYVDWLASEDGARDAWRKAQVPSEAFWSRENWGRFLADLRTPLPKLGDLCSISSVKLLVQPLLDPTEPNLITVRLALENFQKGRSASAEQSLFQVSLCAKVPKPALRWMNLERVKRSYHLSGFLAIPAMGVNGGVVHREDEGFHHLQTTWAPRFVLPRPTPKALPGVPVTFTTLALATTSPEDILGLPKAMNKWIDEVEARRELFDTSEPHTRGEEQREEAKFKEDIKSWRAEASRIERGINLLRESREAFLATPSSRLAIPYRAWLMLNRTFAEGTRNPGWRLFQLAFILTHVPTLASRMPEFHHYFDADFDEERATLLYMTTGGGKSEAFFGVLIFNLFLDRLRGKNRGVTAMIHYPLRLLVLQQANRLFKLLASAELVRRDMAPLGVGGLGEPFEIGFWVGSGNTPNTMASSQSGFDPKEDIPTPNDPSHRDEARHRRNYPLYASKVEAWNKLKECPFCGNCGTGLGLRVFDQGDTKNPRLGIVCLDKGCRWNDLSEHRGKVVPLPFLLVDTDIYARAPSVLLGTIDKLAMVGNNPRTINRIMGMFGLAKRLDAYGNLHSPIQDADLVPDAERLAPAYAGRKKVMFDPFPSLIIQDELHLLEESLGTFGSIFETALFALLRRTAKLIPGEVACYPGFPRRPRMPHVVGATATAADIERQIANLYMLKVVQFPHPGPKLYESFYVRLMEFDDPAGARAERTDTASVWREREASAPWARLYVSLLTNGRAHTQTTVEVISAMQAGITRWLYDLCQPATQGRAINELVAHVSDAPFAQRRRAAIEKCRLLGRADVLASLVNLHRISLCYVNNKKGGDQVMSALERQASKDHDRLDHTGMYKISQFNMRLISGGVDIREIQDVMAHAERSLDLGVQDPQEALRVIVATSAISHGVDVDNFNSMFFAGMPSDVAEYIQASSRVGRTHVGFSLLLPTPQTRRDRFIIEVHEAFHRFLERMISPPAIERWADKAIVRSIPSLFQAYFAGVLYQEQFTQASQKSRVPSPAYLDHLLHAFSGHRKDEYVEGCVDFIQEAIGLRGGVTGHPASPGYYQDLVRQQVDTIVQEIVRCKDGTGELTDLWRNPLNNLQHPMTSLRDVDEAGVITASFQDEDGSRISVQSFTNVMKFLRNRRLGGSAANEADTMDA